MEAAVIGSGPDERDRSRGRSWQRQRRKPFAYGLRCLDHFACSARTWPGNCFRACVQQRWRPSKRQHGVARCHVSKVVRGHGTVPTVRWRDRIHRTSGTAGDEKIVAGLQPQRGSSRPRSARSLECAAVADSPRCWKGDASARSSMVARNWHRVRSWRSTKRSMATASEFSSAGRPTEDCAVR